MTRIDHIAIWTTDLERLCVFYQTWFGVSAGKIYHNPQKGFRSRFVIFPDGGRLEVMTVESEIQAHSGLKTAGYSHIAIGLGSTEAVDQMTAAMRAKGVTIQGEPRWTGDGYYESVILDPDGNPVELTS